MHVKLIISKRFASNTEIGGWKSWENNMKNVLINTFVQKKNNNAANYIEKFNIPTVLMAMFTE
jgi:hypothetical protein